RREGEHDGPFGELHQRLPGPVEKRIQLQRMRQCPEMQREEKRERNPRDAVHDRHPVRGFFSHAKTEKTACIPIQASAAANSSKNKSRERPRQPSHSMKIALSPIGACTVTAATKRE